MFCLTKSYKSFNHESYKGHFHWESLWWGTFWRGTRSKTMATESLDLLLYIQWNFIFELREQSHFHWGPLFSHQKPNDKGQAQLQANNRRKQRNTIKVNKITKNMEKLQFKNGKKLLHKHDKNIQENRTIQISHHWLVSSVQVKEARFKKRKNLWVLRLGGIIKSRFWNNNYSYGYS